MRQFEERRTAAESNDRVVGILGVEEFLSDEVVLATPEVNLVDIPGVGVFSDKPVHHGHRFVRVADFIVGARELV